MRLVCDDQGVFRQIVVKRRRRFSGNPTRQIARVILYAVAVAQFLNHLQVKFGSLLKSLRLNQSIIALQLREALLKLMSNVVQRA